MERDDLLTFLKHYHAGRDNAIPGPKLSAALRISNREIRTKVNELRCTGQPICSCDDGYFYGLTAEEVSGTINQLASRVRNINGANL